MKKNGGEEDLSSWFDYRGVCKSDKMKPRERSQELPRERKGRPSFGGGTKGIGSPKAGKKSLGRAEQEAVGVYLCAAKEQKGI